MIIPGILSSGTSGHNSSFESISTVTVGSGGASSITFSSIPSTFTHLQLRMNAQSNRGTYNIDEILLNMDSTTLQLCDTHDLRSNYQANGTVNSTFVGGAGSDYSLYNFGALGTSTGGQFAGAVIDILDYTNTNKYKTFRCLSGVDTNGLLSGYCGFVRFSSGLWRSTSAVSLIKIYPQYGTLFTNYSHFALYGVKG